MTIKRGGIASVSGNINAKPVPAYCPKCLLLDFQSKLGPRLDYFAVDRDQWLQCYHCGNIVPKHDIAQTGQLTTDVERIESKFHIKHEDEHDIKKPKHRRGFNKRFNREPEIKDPEVRAALKKGAKLISYNET